MTLSKNIYALPFNKKDLIKTISDPRAHFGPFKYAIDFILLEGTTILAPKAGRVIDIKFDSKEGGADPKYNNIKYTNYMTIQHSNYEFSQYVHLKYNSALAELGDKVKQGQPIALSGNTGFSTRPHLHFQIFKLNKTKIGWESLEARFKEKIDIDMSERPIPKDMQKTMKELKRVRRQIEAM